MARIAYIRVSSEDQNTGRQVEALKTYDIDRTFSEKISGKDRNRPQLNKMLDYARDGDTVYIESISRLARNTRDFLEIVDTLTSKGAALVSLKESIDTNTPSGKFMLTVFAALSQLERDTIKQRQREGIDLALAQGRTYGRPRIEISDNFRAVCKQWKDGEITATEAMRLTGTKRNTFYNRVKEL